MAVLIPRKQIEEQNDISGSFRVGGDLSVTGSAVVGGSFAADSEFFLGNQLTDRGEITGSVFLTGSLIIDGDFSFEDVNRILNVTASQAQQSQDTFKYGGILARDFGANVPTLYVSSTDGNDNNDGRSIQFPVKTVKKAAQLATPGFDGRYGLPSGSAFSGYVIRVQAGTYIEDNPVILPKNATIWGSGLRITKINARNPEQDLFHVNSGCYVAEVTMGGLRLFPNQIEPERGFAIAYQPGAFITTSPYIQNCSQISNQENSFAELYEDIPPGGGGLYVNGDAVHPDSPLASMVLDAYTQISPNGVGCLVNGRGFIQLVSFFTNFSYYAIRVNNGGHATLNNSNISFGLFGMYASGSRKIDSYEGGNEDAKLRVRRSYSAIVDVLNKGLEEGLPSITTLNTAEGIKVTQFSQSFSNNVASPKEVIQVGEDFRIVSEIVNSGPKNYPTLLAKSSNIGYDIENPYNISGGTQFSSSISASNNDLLQISSSYRDLLSIFADGTGSYVFKSNNKDVIQISNLEPYSASFTASIGTGLYNKVSSSFDTVIKIVNKGRLPIIISNTSASLYLGDVEPILPTQPISSSIVSLVSSSFSIIYNILNNGTGSPILDKPQNHQTNFEMVRGANNSGWIVNGGIQNNPNTGSNVFTVTNNGSGNYVINGQVNPTLNLIEGQTYVFNIAASGHPFWIKTTQTLGTGDQYNSGVTNNGTQSGTITFVVPVGAPTLYYNCQFHSSMRGVINIVEAGEEIPPVDETEISNINPTITLFRGTKYLFNVSGSFSKSINRFFIRKKPVSGFLGEIDYSSTRNLSLELDYNDGVINNGDDFGVVTFTVPFNAPNELYYVSQNSSQMVGKFNIVNNSATPFNLIRSTMTYPTLINLSQSSSLVGNITASYNILTNNLNFLKKETTNYISSSWAGFQYNTNDFNEEIDGIVTSVANDLLFGGNSGSISTGLDYYLNSTIGSKIEKDVTLTAIKFLSDTSQNLLKSSSFELVDTDTDERYLLRTSILKSKPFIQAETIAFISSSWSEFEYNELSCSRDTGFVINAVVTDLLYGGNERSVEAGDFYYRFPSITTSEQLSQTTDGIRYAGGTTLNIVEGKDFVFPQTSTSASVSLLRKNRQLIQTETIQFINATFPTLDYNQTKCRRDTGFILDAITTDLLYGGNERSINAGNFYYQFPSITTSLQRRQTTAGIKYSKILADFIVQNFKLQTPRISLNTEVGIKITDEAYVTSSLFGTGVESTIVKSNFGIVSGIIKDGVGKIKKAVAKNKRPNWSVANPINVTNTIQFTTTQSLTDFRDEIGDSFEIVASIVSGGLSVIPPLEKSINSLIKVNNITQFTSSSFVENYVTSSLSASFGLVVKIISNGVSVIPPIISNTNDNIFIGNDLPQTGSFINPSYITSVSQSYSIVNTIISGGLEVLPNVVKNTAGNVRTKNIQLFSSSLVATNTEVQSISQSFNTVISILESGVKSFTPTTATYNPANGEFVITIPNHTLKTYDSIYIRPESFVFTCDMDGNRTEHALPGVGQYPYSNKLQILSVTTNTITVNVGVSGPDVDFNPTDATYDPATGEFVVTVGEHDLSIGEGIVFVTRSFAFTCDMDNNHSTKSYPRFGIDPFSVRSIPITAVTENTLTFNVGISGPNKFFTPTAASYDALTGEMILTVGQHGLGIGRGVVLVTGSIAFTCDQDNNQTTHSYPRSGSDPYAGKSIEIIDVGFTQHTVTNAPHNAATGLVTLTIAGHGFSNGDYVKISDNSLTYTCELDGNTIQKSYPRPGYDLPSGRWLEIAGVTTNTFEINVGSSSYTGQHTFVTASANGVQRQDGTFTINVGDGGSASGSIHTFVSASANAVQHLPQSVHTFVSASAGALRHYPQSEHTFVRTTQNSISTLPILIQYTTPSTSSVVIAAYNNIKNNIPFIQAETIAYLTSSWSELGFNAVSYSKDIALIVSGTAEDLLFNSNSASINAGKYFFEFSPVSTIRGSISPNVNAQLFPTLDAILYASQLTQKVIQNTTFVGVDESDVEVANLLVANKEFLRTETIEYISSSWSMFNYNDLTCKRDIGFIIDGIATDLIYGGNERTVNAGDYYYFIPSQATGNQLVQTLEAINYVSSLSQKLIEGVEFVRPDGDVVEASRLLLVNNGLIGEEVVSYVSSSWSNVIYNELSCSRDIRHIINAARTDLVYGGNQRSVIAGEFYFLYPSRATVGGVPSEAAQLDPTVTGIEYGSDLAQKIALSKVLTLVTSSKLEVVDVVRKNIQFIKDNTIEYVNAFYPFLQYNEASCSRDVGFILDGVLTDLIYGGNQRSITSGDFYYRFPSLATAPSQKVETVDGILYAGEMTKLISINELIDNIIIGRNIDNTIKVGNVNQFISNQTGSFTEVLNVSSSFTLVTDIVESGVGSFTPTSASYNPANGEFVMTISNHGLKVGNIIYLRDESFVFTCTMDGNRTEHPLPSVGQPAYNNKLEIKSVTQNTITVNVGKSGPDVEFNPTDATYDPATGEFVVTVGEHDLSVGEGIVFVTRSFAFTCDMDNNQSTKSYPRFGIDPFSVRSIPITAFTENTLTFNVGISGPNKLFTPTNVDYDALTGEMIITVGQHGLGIGRGVILLNNSFAFTCDQDNNQTTHSYPRSGSDPYAGKSIEIIDVGVSIHTVEDAPYNASTGITTLTISNHGFSNGDYIKISDNSLIYTCILDGNTIQKSYPRPGYDLPSGRWLEISNVTTNTFTIDIGPSSYVDSHTFITASANGLERQTGTFTINVGDGGSASGSIHTFVSASQDAVQHLPQSVHTFVSASAGALRHYPQAGHTFVRTTQNSVSTLPIIIENINNTIKVTNITQFTSSISASLQDIEFVSSSFGTVFDIVKNGSGSYTASIYGSASSDASTVAAYNLLKDNISFIRGETIAYISSSWSDFGFYPISASREIELIVSGAAEDLLHGVVSASIVNGKYFFEISSSATISGSYSPNESAQLFPTLDGIRYASRLSNKLIQNILFQTASLEISASKVLIKENRNFIKDEMIAYLSSSWSDFDYNEITCKRDIGFILDGVLTDLVYGGNERSVNAGEFYYRFPSAAITGGNVSPTTDAQLFPTLDGIRYAGDVTQKLVGGSVFQTASLEVSASVNLLRKNRAFIQAETVEYVSSSWSDVVYNVLSCSRDTGFILDGVITDLLYGGEERSVNAGDFYYLFPSRATVGGIASEAAQLDPTLAGVRYAGGISSKIVLNQQFSFPSQSVLNGRSLLKNNKQFIQKETIAFLSSSWSGLRYNEQTASRELGFIIDAVATDLVYGGNEASIEIGNYYYTNPTLAIVDSYADNFGLKKQTVSSINFARGLSEKVVNQTQLVFPGVRRLEAAVRLVNAKGELQRRALSYTNGAFPALIYNEASCSRDTGLIVDSLATDLIYGGNERGIEAATSYYNGQYGSGAEVVDNQRLETLETNRYLRTRAEFIVANAPKEDFGSLIVATGIDYSYNGSGVTFKALPPNQGGSGIPNPDFEITELGGGRIFFTSGNQDGDFRIGTGLSINQATGTLVGRTFSKSLFSLVTPFSLALEG